MQAFDARSALDRKHSQKEVRSSLVARCAADLGFPAAGVAASPLPGPSGNVEYFLWLRAGKGQALEGETLERAVRRAVEEGPQ